MLRPASWWLEALLEAGPKDINGARMRREEDIEEEDGLHGQPPTTCPSPIRGF